MLLASKLFIPRPHSHVVLRERLFERLDAARETALTLVSAPAGFGKTALVSGWARDRDLPTAWLSLDAGDDETGRFWTYLVEAFRTVDDGIGAAALRQLQSPPLPTGETLATIVLNDLAASSPVVCALDDYHAITDEGIHQSLVFLVDHLPAGSSLVVTTRADPPWPLARLRAGGRMVELRAADLRFTEEEATRFLKDAGLELGGDDIRTLESRTEGWIAGLQMAALSLRDRPDAEGFIREFAGSHRFVLDYLAEEVLDQQPPRVRTFLARTSILERLSGGLCDAVTGLGDGQQLLEALENANLFTEPLDDERRWFRYHQLFADVLRARLGELEPDLVPELHRRASEWFEAHELDAEAVHHALEASDVERAVRLIVRTASATFMVANQLLVLDWLGRLPPDAIRSTPVLALVDVWARYVTGDWEGVVPALETAAEAIEAEAGSPERAGHQAQLDGIRAWVAYQSGDLAGCVALAGHALERMPPDGLVPSRIVASALGYGLLLTGETDEARAVAKDVVAGSRRAGDALTESLGISLTGQAFLLDGRLEAARRAFEQAIAAGTVDGEPLPSVAIAQVQLAEILRERNELGNAERLLEEAIAACERALGLPEWVFEGNVTLARVRAARGDAGGSAEAAERAELVLERDIVAEGMEPIAGRALGYRLRHLLATGDVGGAVAWLHARGVSDDGPEDGSPALRALLARTLLAQGETERACRLADRVLGAAEDRPPLGLALDLAVVKALALLKQGREEAAVKLTAEALDRAREDGYVRLFADEGAPMARLVESAAPALPDAAAYLRRVREALGGPENGPGEDLNERELELLRMFAVGRSNAEIARELFLSVNTVKWHARRVYAKLGVHRRAQAVDRARELGIL
ncbi:MAG TPA: LuxR C-terminal-related transcriptional regulator [Gaiellaceae bacterium]|nr:LuxR C-terminal-related transcriptional regulator [Gaiellaceae bacterium]